MATTISGTEGISTAALPFLVGELKFITGLKVPNGFVKASGQTLLRAAYPLLWAYAQESGNLASSQAGKTKGQYGPGDGVTTFTVPDIRGEFVRALDDGAGTDIGRQVGSFQADAFKSHNHTGALPAGPVYLRNYQNYGGGWPGEVTPGAFDTRFTGSTGDGETRPRNIAFLACIFAGA